VRVAWRNAQQQKKNKSTGSSQGNSLGGSRRIWRANICGCHQGSLLLIQRLQLGRCLHRQRKQLFDFSRHARGFVPSKNHKLFEFSVDRVAQGMILRNFERSRALVPRTTSRLRQALAIAPLPQNCAHSLHLRRRRQQLLARSTAVISYFLHLAVLKPARLKRQNFKPRLLACFSSCCSCARTCRLNARSLVRQLGGRAGRCWT